MQIFQARALLKVREADIHNHLPSKFQLVFDDGTTITTTRRRTVFSRFMWRYHIEFPKIRLLPEHHLQHILEKEKYSSSTHTQLCSTISKEIFLQYENDEDVKSGKVDLTDKIGLIAYEQSVGISNFEVGRLAAYASSIDLLDAIELVRHPKIQEAAKISENDGDLVAESYELFKKIIATEPSLDNNHLVRACRSKTVKMGQVLQSILRGRSSEPSGKRYDLHIKTGYLEGNYDPFDFASESRSAPKAQAGTEAPLQSVSYMSRRFQLMMSTVERIEGHDCGNRHYIEWPVLAEELDDEGRVVYPGGIGFMRGKRYWDEQSQTEKELTGNEKHFNGSVLKIRSLLHCRNQDPHSVCRGCFGGLWRNYYNNRNLGHLCTVQFTERVIQNTLGIKHLTPSSSAEGIRYNSVSAYFFRKTKKATNYVLSPLLKRMMPKISLKLDEVAQLENMLGSPSLTDMRINKLTQITIFRIDYIEKGVPRFAHVPVDQGSISAFATIELIKYIREYGWTSTDTNDLQIDLKHWNYDDPLFAIPQMEKSDAAHGQEVGKLLESRMAEISDRQRPESPLSTLQELFELATLKVDIQLSCLEVMIYALMIPSMNNHSLSRGWSDPVLSVARQLIISRSLSAAYAFQGHVNFMLNAQAFFPHFRPDSLFDVFFAPEEMLANHERKRRP